MLRKIVKLLMAIVIICGTKIGVDAVAPKQTECSFENESVSSSQDTINVQNLQLFKVLFNGGTIWRDEILNFYITYCEEKIIKFDRLIDRKIFWNKYSKFSVYSFSNLGKKVFNGERVCLLFYDKTSKGLSPTTLKYDLIAIRLPEEINIESGAEYFPGDSDFIVEFIENHISSKPYMCFINDNWLIFSASDFHREHPNYEKAEDFEKGLSRLVGILCYKLYK